MPILIERTKNRHSDIFYYGFFFACWEKSDVPKSQRFFKDFDDQILDRVSEGGSLQSILRDLVDIVGYNKFRRFFESMSINRVTEFLD